MLLDVLARRVCFHPSRDKSGLYSRMCVSRVKFLWEPTILFENSCRTYHSRGFVNIADSRAFLTRRTAVRRFLKKGFARVLLKKKCDHDRLRKGARLVTYCSRMKNSKMCIFTVSQAQRPATCKSCVISDGEQ